MSLEQNKAVVRRWIEEGWNQGRLEVADELYAPDFMARGSVADPGLELRGPVAVKAFARRTRAAFPDIHFTVEQLLAEEDMVVGVFTVRGTHHGELDGIPATGRRVEFVAVDVWRLAGGRIVERRLALIDRLDLMRQLGLAAL